MAEPVIRVSVAAIAERAGSFLMVEEAIEAGRRVFNQPAGHLEPGETLVEGVCREVMEETAYRFEPAGLVGLYLYRNPESHITYLRVCFHGACVAHDRARPLDAEIVRAVWLTRAEVVGRSERLRTPLVLRCLDDYLAGRRFPLAVIADLAGLP
ncbi:MAG: NUDIX hydrolase [Actinomycetota bacterium]